MHLKETLLEITQLSPDMVINLAGRCHMLSGDNDAVTFHKPAPACMQDVNRSAANDCVSNRGSRHRGSKQLMNREHLSVQNTRSEIPCYQHHPVSVPSAQRI